MMLVEGCADGFVLEWLITLQVAGGNLTELCAAQQMVEGWGQEACGDGLWAEHYCVTRQVGADHAEVMEAWGGGVSPQHYRYCRTAKIRHSEVMEVWGNGLPLLNYAWYRVTGTLHQQVVEFLRTGET
jgi:hypothetical protein